MPEVAYLGGVFAAFNKLGKSFQKYLLFTGWALVVDVFFLKYLLTEPNSVPLVSDPGLDPGLDPG